MTLFYAFVQDEQHNYNRFLITFADRETADEWWRIISTSRSSCAANIARISPQYYTQKNSNYGDLSPFFPDVPDVKPFRRKMFITLLHNPKGMIPFTIPFVTITDHISGKWYFVQSTAEPQSHWYLRIGGVCLVCGDADCNAIHVSSEYRTKFCIRVCNPANASQAPNDIVMIGKDKVLITARKDYILHIDDTGDLKATKGYQGRTDLLFCDLKNRFVTRAEKQVSGEVWEYVESVERDAGEAWELVA